MIEKGFRTSHYIDLDLNLGGNQLQRYDFSLLENNCNLEKVHFGQSFQKTEVTSALFYNNQKLKRVDLTSLKTSIPSQIFNTAKEVEWLSLDDNIIPGKVRLCCIVYAELKNLFIFNLSTVLTPVFVSKKPALKFLSLSQCEIEAVLDSTFVETVSLEVLVLNRNNLKFMTAGQLKGLRGLTYLGKKTEQKSCFFQNFFRLEFQSTEVDRW